jgi:zinc transport system permease protein
MDMKTVFDLFAHEFIQNAVFSGILASLLCSVVGTFVVVKRLVFISGSISHAAFGGLGICYFFGLPPLLGATAVALVAPFILATNDSRAKRGLDAQIGILWASGMAVGALFIFKTPGYAPNLTTYLFGSILAVDRTGVWLILIFALALAICFAVFYQELIAVAFDEEFAAVQGVPVDRFMKGIVLMVGLSIVLLIQLVGIVLVIALLTIPPVISLLLTEDFLGVMVRSAVIGCIMTLGGLALSYAYDLPSGPAIVVLGLGMLFLATIATKLSARADRNRSPAQ